MSLLPPNATPAEIAIAELASHLRDLQVPIRDLWNAETCPAAFLPWLAWSVSVDFWRSDWPEATKRAVIAASPRVHRLKGTVSALKTALTAVAAGVPFRLVEWFQPNGSGAPYTARLEADLTDTDLVIDARPELPNDMAAVIRTAGNIRSHIDVRLTARPSAGERIASRMRPPIARGQAGGEASYVRPFRTGLTVAGHLTRSAVRGRLAGEVQLVRPFGGGSVTYGNLRRPAAKAALMVRAPLTRLFGGLAQTAGHLSTPAVAVRLIVSGAHP